MRQRAHKPPPIEAVVLESYPHGVMVRFPPQGLGSLLNLLSLIARECGGHTTVTFRRAERDTWARFSFKAPETADAFRGAVRKVARALVEPPDEDWKC